GSMTHIGASVDFDGTLTCEEDLTIEGKLTGNIHLRDATLTVAQPALLEADIRAARVVVHGTVTGSISAGQRIELRTSAEAYGAPHADRIDLGGTTNRARSFGEGHGRPQRDSGRHCGGSPVQRSR